MTVAAGIRCVAIPLVLHEGYTPDDFVGLADQDNENDEYHVKVLLGVAEMVYVITFLGKIPNVLERRLPVRIFKFIHLVPWNFLNKFVGFSRDCWLRYTCDFGNFALRITGHPPIVYRLRLLARLFFAKVLRPFQ